jgi:hypothetical protein
MGRTWRGPGRVCQARAVRPTLFEFAGGQPAFLALAPEFRAALRAYMEWAVADMLSYPSPDAAVPAGLAMPRWTWDGLQAGAPSP